MSADEATSGEALAFGTRDGQIRNYFFRQGPVAAHLLTRSGSAPRVIVAFPAGNQGIGLWFAHTAPDVELWAGNPAELELGGGLRGVLRRSDPRDARGIRATLHSSAKHLSIELALLAGVRTLRDYGYGECLENAAAFPALRNETVELLPQGVVRVRRKQIGTERWLELLLRPGSGTRLSVELRRPRARPGCRGELETASPAIEISADEHIELELTALSDEPPLSPIPWSDLFSTPQPRSAESVALSFLSYEEKLEAGSWRFLTYFGRDTLLALRMLMPVLAPRATEAALGSVFERMSLDATGGAAAPGDVAHEEEIGDYAAYRNTTSAPATANVRAPRYDYKMIDDDFLLAPVLADYLRARAGEGSRAHRARVEDFLSRRRSDGGPFRDALLQNLGLVLARARPFAMDDAEPAQKRTKLVGIPAGSVVGQWRDSETGLGFGRYAFDVNAALVPAALHSAAYLYELLGKPDEARLAEQFLDRWRSVPELFRVDVPFREARLRVARYAASTQLRDTSNTLVAERDDGHAFYAIALDEGGAPVPVLHTDIAFALEFTAPTLEFLRRATRALLPPFPAGLMTPVGVLVANPALAPGGFRVRNPRHPVDPDDDVLVPLADLFGPSHYHGTVVWSWQQALLASGLRRQLRRAELDTATRAGLEHAECRVWQAIRASDRLRTSELWSFQVAPSGELAFRAFGDVRADADESNAIQLWSTVYLAVREPSTEQNPNCGVAR